MVNHYEILKLPNYSDTATVRKAYLKLMKKYHPDINPSADAQLKSQQVNAAYDALETTAKKASYDRRLKWHLTPKSQRTYTTSTQTNTRFRQAKKSYKNPITRAERVRRHKLRKQEQKIKEYAHNLKSLTIEIRYTLCAVYGFFGLLLLGIATSSTPFPESLLGGFIASVFWFHGCMVFVNEYYKYHDYKSRITPLGYDLNKRTSRMLYWLYLGGFFLMQLL